MAVLSLTNLEGTQPVLPETIEDLSGGLGLPDLTLAPAPPAPVAPLALSGQPLLLASGADEGPAATPPMAAGASYVVDIATDEDDGNTSAGDLSLREAIKLNDLAGGGGTITFASSLAGSTITLAQALGELSLTKAVTIDGDTNGDDKADITISGNGANRIMKFQANSACDLNSLNLTGGYATTAVVNFRTVSTGTILNVNSTLTMRHCTVTSSSGPGSAVTSFATLNLVDCTFTANSGTGASLQATTSGATVNAVQSTFSGNTSYSVISLENASAGTFNGCTISGNTGTIGFSARSNNSVKFLNTVLAGNTSSWSEVLTLSGTNTISSAQNSVFGLDVGFAINGTSGNLESATAAQIALGPLADNGGPVKTMAITSASSVLVDAGDDSKIPSGVTTDAAGGNRIAGAHVDIGAFEFGNAPRNKPPVIGISASTVNEGDKLVQNVGATDFENDPLIYTISGGADAAKFVIDSKGALSFAAAPDFETPGDADANNVYDVEVQVSDGTSTVKQSIAVTVADVSEGGGSTDTPPFRIVTESMTVAGGTLKAGLIEVDNPNSQPLRFRIDAGLDGSQFVIDPDTGLLTFRRLPDYSIPRDRGGDNTYDVTIKVRTPDGVFTKTISVTVTDAINPLVVSGGASPSARAGQAADDAEAALRKAVALANATPGHDFIVLDESLRGQTLVLDKPIHVRGNLTILGDVNGDAKADLTLSGGGTSRLFVVEGAHSKVTLQSLTLADGQGTEDAEHGTKGGAVLVKDGATLTITDTTIRDSHGEAGGAIYADGTVNAANVLFIGNGAEKDGGAVAVADHGSASFVNATLTGNKAGGDGGGIAGGEDVSVSLGHATLVANTAAGAGGGVAVRSGALAVANTVIAGNAAASDPDLHSDGAEFEATRSVFGSEVSAFTRWIDGNHQNVRDVGLGPLLDNGGSTLTFAPRDGSTLINAGGDRPRVHDLGDIEGDGNRSETVQLDGRYFFRDWDGAPDIGAVEHTRNEHITGTTGDDIIKGGAGNDLIDGRKGHDHLSGGIGYDSFVLHTGRGIDVVHGFKSGVDTIRLSAREFGLTKGEDSPADIFALGRARDADDRIVYDDATGKLYFDADGNGSGEAELMAILKGAPELAAGDFLIV